MFALYCSIVSATCLRCSASRFANSTASLTFSRARETALRQADEQNSASVRACRNCRPQDLFAHRERRDLRLVAFTIRVTVCIW